MAKIQRDQVMRRLEYLAERVEAGDAASRPALIEESDAYRKQQASLKQAMPRAWKPKGASK